MKVRFSLSINEPTASDTSKLISVYSCFGTGPDIPDQPGFAAALQPGFGHVGLPTGFGHFGRLHPVSTDKQDHALQLDAVRAVGCGRVFEDLMSGAANSGAASTGGA